MLHCWPVLGGAFGDSQLATELAKYPLALPGTTVLVVAGVCGGHTGVAHNTAINTAVNTAINTAMFNSSMLTPTGLGSQGTSE